MTAHPHASEEAAVNGETPYGVKKFIYIAAALAIVCSIVSIVLKLSAGSSAGLFYSYSTIVIAVLCIVLVRINPNAR
ncbi:hypothetical protein [Kocuria sp.]|uniref:hypothetical protein n=1 Tax=Kocuria sp. TaxID=1871328 RepID=UPI0026DC4137|nr:hypothetical protein [Kocuria sp.]MDO4919154.1 hypothetical protein [Kocuria sp.]